MLLRSHGHYGVANSLFRGSNRINYDLSTTFIESVGHMSASTQQMDEVRDLDVKDSRTSNAAPHFVACSQDSRTLDALPLSDMAVAGGAKLPREFARQ